MPVAQDRKLTVDDTQAAWQLYADTFSQLIHRAALRHLLTEVTFAEICADERIDKFRAFGGEELVGVAALTNRLEAWPLIEPAYFAHHWPDHYARGAIWYCGFVGARPNQAHAFTELINAMQAVIRSNNGITAMDYCKFNADKRQLPQITQGLLSRIAPDTRSAEVDSQHIYVIRFDGEPVR